MAVSRTSFAAAVQGWADATKDDLTAVFRQSASDVIEEMQKPVGGGGNMPVDTGFLRASLQVGINTGPVPLSREHPSPGEGSFTAPQVDLVIAGAEIGDTIMASYGANYAGHVNYGAKGRQPRLFVELAAQNWDQIVNRVVASFRARRAP